MWLLFLGLFLFFMLVVLHEYGHFLVAKRNGVEVEEFGVGFPPKLFGKTFGKGIFRGYYTVNLLPLGGFVRLKGENDSATEKGSLGAASTNAKLRIMLAGVAVNFVAALLFFMMVAWVGMPQIVPNQFTVPSDSKVIRQNVYAAKVTNDSPAAKAGIKSGAQILSINNQPVNNGKSLTDATKANAGQNTPISYIQNGQTQTSQVTLLSQQEVQKSKDDGNPKGYLGIVPRDYTLLQSTWSAPIVAVGVSAQFTGLTIKALANAIISLVKALVSLVMFDASDAKKDAAKASQNVAGPVGIFAILQQNVKLGYQFILFIVGILSLTLAIMNFLPIPALDGGRAFVMMLYKVLNKPLSAKTEERIHGTGFAVLMVLFAVIVIVDINRFY